MREGYCRFRGGPLPGSRSPRDARGASWLRPERVSRCVWRSPHRLCGAIRSSGNAIGNMPRLSDIDASNVLETLQRISPVKPVEFFFRLGPQDSAGGISLHFEGNGWKLSGIQLPHTAVEALAQNLGNRRNG